MLFRSSPLSSLIQYSVTIDFGFEVGFWWQRWIYVWVSTMTVGLALGFNGAGGEFVVGLMDLGFEGGGGFGFCGGFVVGLMALGIEGGSGFGSDGFGYRRRRWVWVLQWVWIWVSQVVGGLGLRWVSA